MNAVATAAEPSAATSVDTRALVKQAADELLITGERPTVANIRARIGRGSATTINSALTEWWQQLADRLASARARPDVPAPVLDAADRLWTVALQHADQSLSAYREAADQNVAEAKDLAATALLAKGDADERLREIQGRYQGLDALRAELERRVASETERRQAAEARIAEAQADGERQAGELRSRVRHLEELLAKEQARFDSMERRLSEQLAAIKTALDEAEARHRSEASAWRSEKNELLSELHQVREQQVRARGELVATQGQLVELRDAHAALQADRERLIADRASLQTSVAHMQTTEDALRGDVAALQASLRAVQEDRQELNRQLEDARKALAETSTAS